MQDLLESNKKPFQMKIWKLLRAIQTFYKMTFLVQTIIIKHIKRGWLIITRRNVDKMVIVHTKVKYYCVMLSNNNFGVTALFLFCFCTRVIAFLSNRISSHIAIYKKKLQDISNYHNPWSIIRNHLKYFLSFVSYLIDLENWT